MSDVKQIDVLDRMIIREDVLQICYWYQGEGLGDKFNAQSVMPFLQNEMDIVAEVIAELAEDGTLIRDGDFYESFTEFQQSTHGECNAGCCDGDEVCDHDDHHHH